MATKAPSYGVRPLHAGAPKPKRLFHELSDGTVSSRAGAKTKRLLDAAKKEWLATHAQNRPKTSRPSRP
jgi:hypothetical protein